MLKFCYKHNAIDIVNKNRFGFCIHQYTNAGGYHCLAIAKKRKQLEIIAEFETMVEAEEVLLSKAKEAGICCNYIATSKPKPKDCECPANDPSPEFHNQQISQLTETLHVPFKQNFMLIGKGRDRTERSVIQVEDGQFRGFGYFDPEYVKNFDELEDAIQVKPRLSVFEYFIKMAVRKREYDKMLAY